MTSREKAPVPEFGIKLEGIEYIDRPSVYAIIKNHDELIAVIEALNGYFLPGGGSDTGETELETLNREIREELGYQVSVSQEIGEAVEYLKAAREQTHYHIRSKFYKAQLGLRIGEGEGDHRLIWLTQEEALKLLTRKSQAWAVQSMAEG